MRYFDFFDSKTDFPEISSYTESIEQILLCQTVCLMIWWNSIKGLFEGNKSGLETKIVRGPAE